MRQGQLLSGLCLVNLVNVFRDESGDLEAQRIIHQWLSHGNDLCVGQCLLCDLSSNVFVLFASDHFTIVERLENAIDLVEDSELELLLTCITQPIAEWDAEFVLWPIYRA